VARRTAETIVAELGCDMTRFPTAGHAASWAGLCPGHHESAGKRLSGRTRFANRVLRQALIESARGAVLKRDCDLAAQYRRLVKRRRDGAPPHADREGRRGLGAPARDRGGGLSGWPRLRRACGSRRVRRPRASPGAPPVLGKGGGLVDAPGQRAGRREGRIPPSCALSSNMHSDVQAHQRQTQAVEVVAASRAT
jgi:hypothetical protein